MIVNLSRVSPEKSRFYRLFGAMILAAWGLLIVLQRSPYAELLGHESLGEDGIPIVWRAAGFLVSWVLMTVVMMLPGSLPHLRHYIQPEQQRKTSGQYSGWVILGYLSPWIVFGLIIFLGDSAIHHLTEEGAPLEAASRWIAPAIIFSAGLYQLTPVKRSFLRRCQAALSHSPGHSAEPSARTAAWSQGLRLGGICMGSCWALMLLMFALGHNQFGWMLALGGVMAAEGLAPWGYSLARLVGAALLVWAVVVVMV